MPDFLNLKGCLACCRLQGDEREALAQGRRAALKPATRANYERYENLFRVSTRETLCGS